MIKEKSMTTSEKVYNIFFDKDLNSVVMEWKGYATSKQFKEGTELMLNTLIKHNTTNVLADIKEMTLIGMEDQRWLENIFLPRAIDFGFKSIAIIQPESYFNKVAVESISYKIDQAKLSIKIFDNIIEAKEWLKQR
jgi:hypothetical protein